MKRKKIIDSVLIAILFAAVTASVAMLFNDTKSQWYQSLIKPVIQPPAIVFIIGWSVIYLLFAISLAVMIYYSAGKKTYILYSLQAVLNVLWCLMFFTLHQPIIAFAVIIIYLIITYITVKSGFSVNKTASFLFIPQICWLTFATVLNYMIVLLN